MAPARLPDLDRIVNEWEPDLVVHECTDLAAPIAAAAAGVPTVTQGWGLVPTPGLTAPAPSDVIPLWRARGLEPDQYAGIFGRIHLHPVPPSLQKDAVNPVGSLQPMRLAMAATPGARLPDWAEQLASGPQPVVYVSLGTHPIFNQPDFFRTILNGLALLGCEVVATTGDYTDPASLGPHPENIHLERWLPLPKLLPHCSLVVCHAGSGTVLASLVAGLPLVLLPRGADQFDNAAACARAGVARVILPEEFTSDAIARHTKHLLESETYRQAAARLRAEINAMPAPGAVVPILEQLAAGGRL
jgi:hypothetical protein